MINKKQAIILLLISSLFQACSLNNNTVKSVVQTNSASQIEEFKTEILKDLIKYKKKLDLRNPNAYNKNIQSNIFDEIKTKQDFINLIQDGKKLSLANEYFYYAFLPQKINNRNDFLILGIYKLIFKAFMIDKGHRFSAIQYNKEDMINLYEYLQVVRWKIKTARDEDGNYLFNTWQNNWQIELEKRFTGDYSIINDLSYIKENKETIFDPSNFSYEIVLSKIITNVEHCLRKINVEPYEMSVSALKSFIFIL